MDAAKALIDGLGEERIRWTEQSAQFKSEIDRLVGDVLLLTGFLSYTGPFNQEFRAILQASWVDKLFMRKIPVSMNLNITESLIDNATVKNFVLIFPCGYQVRYSLDLSSNELLLVIRHFLCSC